VKPQKPRPAGSAHDAFVRLLQEIAIAEGRDKEAGAEIAADFLGCSKSLIYRASDPDQREDIGFRRVAQLAGHFGAETMAVYFARLAGGDFVPGHAHAEEDTLGALTADAAKKFGDTLHDLVGAIEDGRISQAERRKIMPGLFDLQHVLGHLIRKFCYPENVSRSEAAATPP